MIVVVSEFKYAMSFEWACVNVVHCAKVADALEQFPNGLHVNKLAKLVNLEGGKLACVFCFLVTQGCFVEDKVFTPLAHAHHIHSLPFKPSCTKLLCKQSSLTDYAFKFQPGHACMNHNRGCLQKWSCFV